MNKHMEHPAQDDLQAYLDGELDPITSEEVQDHLKTCSSCQSEMAWLESLIVRLESLGDVALERDLSPVILSNIQHQDKVPQGLTWTLIAEGIAAGVVLGLLIPAIRSTLWIPRLIDTQLELRAAINIFLTQLVSNWMVWWAQLQFSFSRVMTQFRGPLTLPEFWPSPWVLILMGAGAGLLVNFILLRNSYQITNGNHKE
jgi:hypothetical protein